MGRTDIAAANDDDLLRKFHVGSQLGTCAGRCEVGVLKSKCTVGKYKYEPVQSSPHYGYCMGL